MGSRDDFLKTPEGALVASAAIRDFLSQNGRRRDELIGQPAPNGLSKTTVDRIFLADPQISAKTLAAIERILGTTFLLDPGAVGDVSFASERHGEYAKRHYERLIVGSFTTIRPAYEDPSIKIKVYQTVISWDDKARCFVFAESGRNDPYSQSGEIFIPIGSTFMYLLTVKRGSVRTILISQPDDAVDTMRGFVLSQYNWVPNSSAKCEPVVAPIVYKRETAPVAPEHYDEIDESDGRFKGYARLISETLTHHVRVAIPIFNSAASSNHS
jgi:hypothetical protein